MTWYYLLFFITLFFFIIKFLMSMLFGDIDVDFDTDGDVDFDIFKGLVHFLLGFSAYLSSIAYFDNNSYNNITYNSYQFIYIDYIIAILVGFIFMVSLFKLYQLMLKLNHNSEDELNLDNYKCTILINNGIVYNKDKTRHKYAYTALVNTYRGSRKINILSKKNNLKVGSEYKIKLNEKGYYEI